MMGTQAQWFSAKIRLVCLVESIGLKYYVESVHVFRANDRKSALLRALDVGRTHEKEYLNAEGQKVRWCLKEITSLDLLQVGNLDGAEVYSALLDPAQGEQLPFESIFYPERSEPVQTL